MAGTLHRTLTLVLGFWFGEGIEKPAFGFLGFKKKGFGGVEEMEGGEISLSGGNDKNILELKRKEAFDIASMTREREREYFNGWKLKFS